MKKILALILSLSLVFTLVACGNQSNFDSEQSEDKQSQTSSNTNEDDENSSSKEESDEVVSPSLSITDDGTIGTLKATGISVSDFIKLKESGKECFFFIDLCDSTEETLYTFNLEVLSDGWSYRMDDEITGESDDANGDIGDGVIEFSFKVGVLDLTELKTASFGYFDDNDEYFNGEFFDVSEIQISLTDKFSNEELDDEQQGEDSEEEDTDNNSWEGKYIVSSGSSETYQERASDTLIVTENTITFCFDDTEFVLDYDINSLVTAPELSNYGAGENDAVYASSNDNDFIIVFSDPCLIQRDIMIFNTTLLDEEDYLLFTLRYVEDSSEPDSNNINNIVDTAFLETIAGDYMEVMRGVETVTMKIELDGTVSIIDGYDDEEKTYTANIKGLEINNMTIDDISWNGSDGAEKLGSISFDNDFCLIYSYYFVTMECYEADYK